MGFARAAADRVLFMDDGLMVEQGPPAQIFDRAAPRAHARLHRPDPAALMSSRLEWRVVTFGDRRSLGSLRRTFLELHAVMAKYLPDIIDGIFLTIELAVLVVVDRHRRRAWCSR